MDKLKVEDKLNFEMTRTEADLMIRGLGKLPLEESLPLVTNLQNQFQAQTAKPETSKDEKVESEQKP